MAPVPASASAPPLAPLQITANKVNEVAPSLLQPSTDLGSRTPMHLVSISNLKLNAQIFSSRSLSIHRRILIKNFLTLLYQLHPIEWIEESPVDDKDHWLEQTLSAVGLDGTDLDQEQGVPGSSSLDLNDDLYPTIGANLDQHSSTTVPRPGSRPRSSLFRTATVPLPRPVSAELPQSLHLYLSTVFDVGWSVDLPSQEDADASLFSHDNSNSKSASSRTLSISTSSARSASVPRTPLPSPTLSLPPIFPSMPFSLEKESRALEHDGQTQEVPSRLFLERQTMPNTSQRCTDQDQDQSLYQDRVQNQDQDRDQEPSMPSSLSSTSSRNLTPPPATTSLHSEQIILSQESLDAGISKFGSGSRNMERVERPQGTDTVSAQPLPTVGSMVPYHAQQPQDTSPENLPLTFIHHTHNHNHNHIHTHIHQQPQYHDHLRITRAKSLTRSSRYPKLDPAPPTPPKDHLRAPMIPPKSPRLTTTTLSKDHRQITIASPSEFSPVGQHSLSGDALSIHFHTEQQQRDSPTVSITAVEPPPPYSASSSSPTSPFIHGDSKPMRPPRKSVMESSKADKLKEYQQHTERQRQYALAAEETEGNGRRKDIGFRLLSRQSSKKATKPVALISSLLPVSLPSLSPIPLPLSSSSAIQPLSSPMRPVPLSRPLQESIRPKEPKVLTIRDYSQQGSIENHSHHHHHHHHHIHALPHPCLHRPLPTLTGSTPPSSGAKGAANLFKGLKSGLVRSSLLPSSTGSHSTVAPMKAEMGHSRLAHHRPTAPLTIGFSKVQ